MRTQRQDVGTRIGGRYDQLRRTAYRGKEEGERLR